MKKIPFLLFSLFIGITANAQKTFPSQYVDPFIGTKGGGNTFPGACVPFGMVKLGPDCGELTENAGYSPDKEIQGFSHTHVSGTGGGPKYGNVLIMPVTGQFEPGKLGSLRSDEQATVGYYSAVLNKYAVKAELSATKSVGFHQYIFPKSNKSSIVIDLGSFLGKIDCKDCMEGQRLVGSEIEIVSDTVIEGYTRVRGGWNQGKAYTVYFSAVLNTPATSFGTWKEGKIKPGNKVEFDTGEKSGAYLSFNTKDNQVIKLKVGISFLGILKARENVRAEVPGWDFRTVHQNAVDLWNKNLAPIEVQTSSEDLKKMFYTAMYHAMLMPVDRTGENPLWVSPEPYYDDYYAIWDTFRATSPLLTIIHPARQRDIIRSLINIYDHEGYMPDARSGNSSGRTQGGSNSDVLITDAYVKGLKGIDYEKGLQSMLDNAEKNPGSFARSIGRGGIEDYNTLGYISTNYERSGNRTVEYAYNDYCISDLARRLGKDSISNKYLKRSGNWKNLWKPITNHGSYGFIMPRKADGSWDETLYGCHWIASENRCETLPFSPLLSGTWPDFFYEANSWEYSLYVPQDVPGLIKACGGNKAFENRLDTFFVNGYFDIGNEPSFITPCLYNYIGRPDLTAERVRTAIQKNFNASIAGLPGNDDSGAMSSWVIFHSMGFFPNAGQDLYLISAPAFEKVTLNLENGKHFIVQTHKLSVKNKYIVSARLNGKSFDQNWFRHADILQGGTLEFTMGDKPSNWGKTNLPPSPREK